MGMKCFIELSQAIITPLHQLSRHSAVQQVQMQLSQEVLMERWKLQDFTIILLNPTTEPSKSFWLLIERLDFRKTLRTETPRSL